MLSRMMSTAMRQRTHMRLSGAPDVALITLPTDTLRSGIAKAPPPAVALRAGQAASAQERPGVS